MHHVSLSVVAVLCIAAASFARYPLLASPQKEKDVTYTAVAIPKFASTWFDRLDTGLKKAGAELKVAVTQIVPSPPGAAQQVKLIEKASNQGSDAILVVPDDPRSVVQAFSRAQARKIVTITHQSPHQTGADYDVEMIDNVLFGRLAMEEMVRALGSSAGEFAVYVGSFTTPEHNMWADAAIALAREKYPDLKLVGERFPVSEDQGLSHQTTLDLLAKYPAINAFLVFGSQGGPGVAQAVREKGLIEKVVVISTTGPDQASPCLKDGSLNASILWDPAEAGYAMVYLARLALEGKRSTIDADLDIPGLGRPLSFSGNTLIYNRPIILTKENVDTYSGF